METESLQTDDCFKERLIYSDSENSDVDDTIDPISKEPTTQKSNDDCLSPTNKDHTETVQSDQNHLSNDSDEGDFNKSIKKVKKTARILCSDDENDPDDNDNEPQQTNKTGNDSQIEDFDENSMEHQAKASVRPSIYDSDTKTSSDGDKNQSEAKNLPTKSMKKLKKKKKSEPRKRVIKNQSDSESNDDDVVKPDKKQKKSTKRKQKSDHSGSSSSTGSGSGSGSSSASDSNSSAHDNEASNASQTAKPREKTVQRMSAKMAEQQMKEIQSESQRMARELPLTIPYHKPKQHSLKEFLSRRSIVQQQERLKSKPLPNAAIGIKMSKDELATFMEEMERRTREAEEFFQEQEEEYVPSSAIIKSDDSEDDDWTDKSSAKETKPVEEETPANETPEIVDIQMGECQDIEPLPSASEPLTLPSQSNTSENVAECAENTENVVRCADNIVDQHNENENQMTVEQPAQSSPPKTSHAIEFHTDRTELDDELDAMLENEIRPKPSIPTDYVPKLKGGDGFVIDLETNDLKPKSQDGIQELFSRFIKSACVKKNATAETQNVSIFQTNTGTVERHQFHVNLDEKPKVEAKPGESLFKLRSELGKKIKENREKLIAQRLQEKKEQELAQKQMESGDDEEEICEEEEDDEEEKEIEQDADECADDKSNEMINMEAEESDQNESDDSDHSESESINVDLDVTADATAKPRKRIISMDDDDSDDEQPNMTIDTVKSDNRITVEISESTQIPDANQTLDESFKTINSHDMSVLESEILQLDNSEPNAELNKSETSKLFQDSNEDDEIDESQLMALCSGAFVTQYPENVQLTGQNADQSTQYNEPTQNGISMEIIAAQDKVKETVQPPMEHATGGKNGFLSSDDEEINNKDANAAIDRVKKKHKKPMLVYSDDEDDIKSTTELEEVDDEVQEEEECIEEEEEQEQIDDEEEDVGERYVEYDSDENEVEVELKKTDVRKKASDFFENEAELSGSEIGSDDEDEKELDHYEAELGDSDKFDKNKLRDELERIRLREQIDEDARELRILTERFIEEEDNGQERERKFRWKHLNNSDMMDDGQQNTNQDSAAMLNNSDDENENEAEWRRIRYEREQLLKQQIKENEAIVERTSIALEVTEQKTPAENVTVALNSSSTKRISFIKPVATPKVSSPFLISKSDLSTGHLSRKSFLNRDSPILEKLAGLSKPGGDGETILNTAKGKGNYVFIATEKKDSSKRKSENDMGGKMAEAINPSKKSKLEHQKSTKLKAHTKAFFESLN